jgi:hypothetical protein
MAEAPADLKAAVHEQSDARVAMDIQGYSKYLTPDAIDSLRASFQGMPPRVSHYNIESITELGADWVADVRYFMRDQSFIVRSRWGQKDGGWMVLHAERLWEEGQKRPGFFSRLAASILGPLARLRRSRK